MSERTVKLDVGTQANTRADSHAAHAGGSDLGQQASEENVDLFRRALTGDAQVSATSATVQVHAPGAFGLFGAMKSLDRAAQVVDGACSPRPLARDDGHAAQLLVSEVADRVLVSADDGREARITVRDDVMPGVEIRIAQEQGRWVVSFFIRDTASFQALQQSGQIIANELAERLRSAVEVQLFFDDASAHTFFAAASRGDSL